MFKYMQQFSFFGLYTKKIWTIDYIYTAIWVVEKKLLLMLLVQNFGNELLSPLKPTSKIDKLLEQQKNGHNFRSSEKIESIKKCMLTI